MADIAATVGLVLLGAIGAAAAMIFMGFRLPSRREKTIIEATEEIRRDFARLERILPK